MEVVPGRLAGMAEPVKAQRSPVMMKSGLPNMKARIEIVKRDSVKGFRQAVVVIPVSMMVPGVPETTILRPVTPAREPERVTRGSARVTRRLRKVVWGAVTVARSPEKVRPGAEKPGRGSAMTMPRRKLMGTRPGKVIRHAPKVLRRPETVPREVSKVAPSFMKEGQGPETGA
jgi:hypothetical protein